VMHIEGWIGCLESMIKDQNGIAIIRRGRVVQMAGRAQWMPAPKIFRNTGSPLDKRLVGELYCDQIPTTKIKSEVDTRISDPLALELRRQIDQLPPNVIKQAAEYRDTKYNNAYAEWKHTSSGDVSISAAPASVGGITITERGADATNASKSEDAFSLNYGTLTNPADSSTFSVQLIAASKGHGGSVDWKWNSGFQDKTLSIVVSRLLLKNAVSDPDDETVWLAVRLIAAIALNARQGDEETQAARSLLKLAENIVKER